jgi:hypothetical protein
LCCCQNCQSLLLPFFLPALSIIQIIHSFLLSRTIFLTASFSSSDVCFHITNNIFQFIFLTPDTHMHMARHNTPSINFKASTFLTVFPGLNYHLHVLLSYVYIYPINCYK